MAIKKQKNQFPVRFMCRLLEVQTSSFYAWMFREANPREDRQTEPLVTAIRVAHKLGRGTYGSPRIHQVLKADGLRVSRRRVASLMRLDGLSGNRKRRFVKTTDSAHPYPVARNLLARDFSAKRPNEKWVTDITYLATPEGWVYLASIMDLFSRRIVGWAMATSMCVALPLAALRRAVETRNPPPGLIHHSDRGSQYASVEYQAELKRHGMLCSMSRRGDCWDNAPAESLFGRLKEELVYRTQWESHSQVFSAVDAYFRGFYNHQRLHSSLDFLSPAEYELEAVRRQLNG